MTDEQRAAELLREAEREAWLSRKALFRLGELAKAAGISKSKVRDDVKRGNLRTVQMRAFTRWYAYVERDEARRYLGELFRCA